MFVQLTVAAVAGLVLAATPEAPIAPSYLSNADAATDSVFADGDVYDACVALIAEDVEIGRAAAQRWALEGGGAKGQHCLAIADLAAGFPRLAATRLVTLGEREEIGGPDVRARIFAEAALAYLDADASAEARDAAARAANLSPDQAELNIVAAKAHAADGAWQAAADAVTAAEEAGVVTAEAYVVRAKARHALQTPRLAAEDVVAALQLDPRNIDALVLRGELAQSGVAIVLRSMRATDPENPESESPEPENQGSPNPEPPAE